MYSWQRPEEKQLKQLGKCLGIGMQGGLKHVGMKKIDIPRRASLHSKKLPRRASLHAKKLFFEV